MTVIGMRVWELGTTAPYDLDTEIAAVQQVACDLGWDRYDLFGFSAGATVALAVTRVEPDAVRTLALFEPATIGRDDFCDEERQWRSDLNAVRALPPAERPHAFRRLCLAAGEPVPMNLPAPPPWGEQMDKLEDMLADVGFDSADLNELNHPLVVMTGTSSNPRFLRVAERLVEVVPGARSTVLPSCSHLAPPHRVAPSQLATELRSLWRPRPT